MPTLDTLVEELKLIQNIGTRKISIIGTRNLSLTHQQLVEILSYALVLSGNIVITSGGSSGVNSAVIKGGCRADSSKLEVILPQTIGQQPTEVQNAIIGIKNIIEHPDRQNMTLADASRICNREIIEESHQLICFLYHDSHTLKEAIEYAHMQHKIVTVFYLD
ncbi:MAG: DNA recombination-mediator protein A [Candidatus Melainabacteria bacterium]|nr:DNA recombination-mediator protein A [Candidatus Melainabacteria bacterium]MBI3309386.1 DNA recombination-mediator protein A [Candidatus Melainabacteria bacterium]